MGSGGYRSAIPKWQNLEAEITAKGIIPETIEKNWPQCAKNWFYAHGGSLNPDTGKLIFGQKIERATQRLAHAREEADSGVFKPNRPRKFIISHTRAKPTTVLRVGMLCTRYRHTVNYLYQTMRITT